MITVKKTTKASQAVSPSKQWLGVPIILLASLILTSMLGFACKQINEEYFSLHPYRLDPSFYSCGAASLHDEIAFSSTGRVAFREMLTNNRNPYRVIPVILLAPKLLVDQAMPLATALPSLFIFLALTGLFIQRRTESLTCSIAVMTMFATVPGLIHPTYGLGTFFLDLVAALFLGSAAICMLEYGRNFQRGWLVAFALLICLSLFSRYSAAAYVVFCLAPALATLFIIRARSESIKASLFDCILVSAVGFLVAGGYVFLHFASNFFYYTKLEPEGNGTVLASANALLPEFVHFIGLPILVALALLAFTPIFVKVRPTVKWELFAGGWLMCSALVFNILIVRFVGREYNHHPILYAVPFFFTGALVFLQYSQFQKHMRKLIIGFAAVTACTSVILSTNQVQEDILTVSSTDVEEKALHRNISKLLCSQPDGRFWYFFVDDQAHNIQNECQYGMGKFRGFPMSSFLFFTNVGAFWDARHVKGVTTETICKRICKATDECLDLVIVFDNPEDARDPDKKFLTHDDARATAESVARMVKNSTHWRKVKEFTTRRYGRLAAYVNLDCQGKAYRAKRQGQGTRAKRFGLPYELKKFNSDLNPK